MNMDSNKAWQTIMEILLDDVNNALTKMINAGYQNRDEFKYLLWHKQQIM